MDQEMVAAAVRDAVGPGRAFGVHTVDSRIQLVIETLSTVEQSRISASRSTFTKAAGQDA